MKTFKTLAILAALAPVAALAETSEADLQAVRDAMTAVGCMVNNDTQAASVETATGFDEAKLEEVVADLRALGEIEDQTGNEVGIRLISGDCAN
ncbi:MAG: hypothetical protein ACP5EN_11045 [Rhodovulum sp.]